METNCNTETVKCHFCERENSYKLRRTVVEEFAVVIKNGEVLVTDDAVNSKMICSVHWSHIKRPL
jgi:hypothetical protein